MQSTVDLSRSSILEAISRWRLQVPQATWRKKTCGVGGGPDIGQVETRVRCVQVCESRPTPTHRLLQIHSDPRPQTSMRSLLLGEVHESGRRVSRRAMATRMEALYAAGQRPQPLAQPRHVCPALSWPSSSACSLTSPICRCSLFTAIPPQCYPSTAETVALHLDFYYMPIRCSCPARHRPGAQPYF